jgi:membrane protease YdiL (CAAX protease family)
VVGFYGLMPLLMRLGMLPYYAYLLGVGIPLATLLAASLGWLSLEGYALTWKSTKARFRLKRMGGRDWLWSIGALILGSVLGFGLVSQFSKLLIDRGLMPIPASLPGFVSPATLTDPMAAYDAAVGGLRGNWLPVLAIAITLVFNVLGEELWWRGVVLPRQELAFGRWTWVAHGLMWAAFHIFKWWDVLNLVPVCLSLALVCTRRKSTTPGILIHGITNGISLVPVVAGVLGLVG